MLSDLLNSFIIESETVPLFGMLRPIVISILFISMCDVLFNDNKKGDGVPSPVDTSAIGL